MGVQQIITILSRDNFKYLYNLIKLTSAIAIISVLILEYGFNVKPCILCYYERYPYYCILAASIFTDFKPEHRKLFLNTASIVLFGGFVISIYHSGVEIGLFEGTEKCLGLGKINPGLTFDQVESIINSNQVASCRHSIINIMKLSLANWNALLSLGLCIITIICLWSPKRGK